ncbi:hypothetical protein GCM10008935_11130 [Alkalibacillus silvisoli]|uniref:Uncharacterized protein n=2 Tax=Alkalibacillus silvisoli TaxID=392823 RepID=A0ABP3JLS3_9BACI
MRKFIPTIILNHTKNDHGLIFPTLVFYLLTFSMSLVILFSQAHYQQEQLNWSDEQLTIQNLINNAIFDFGHSNVISTNNEENMVFEYETGEVSIVYEVLNNQEVELRMVVNTNNDYTYEHFTTMMYNN